MRSNRLSLSAAALALLLSAPGAEAQDAAAPASAPPDSGLVRPLELVVDVSDRTLTVQQGDEVLRTYTVAVGRERYPTPRGEFHIRRIVWNPRWVPPNTGWARGKRAAEPGDPNNPMGRVKLFFREPDYYVHGTNNEESLGTAASHGCVRMANEDAISLAQLVMEHGGELRSPGWFTRVLNRVRNTRQVTLSRPVRISVRE